MAVRSPSDRGRRAEPAMVPADLGAVLGADLWAVIGGPCRSTWARPRAGCGDLRPYDPVLRRIWQLKFLPEAYGQNWVPNAHTRQPRKLLLAFQVLNINEKTVSIMNHNLASSEMNDKATSATGGGDASKIFAPMARQRPEQLRSVRH